MDRAYSGRGCVGQVITLKTRVDGCEIVATDDGYGTVTLSFINN